MKAKLNTHLLSTLPRVLRMTHNEVADASGISIAHWYRLVKKPDKITVQQLIDLANGLYVPVSKFFSFDKADVVGVREDYILRNYQNCYYDSEAVHSRIGRGTATSWREAADAVGMHWTNVASSLLAVSRTPVTRLLDLCDAFDFDLFDFLVDPNREPKKRKTAKQTAEAVGDDALRAEVRELTGKLADMNAAVSDLTARFDDLLKRHTALLDRHNSLERTVRDYLGLDSRIDMAANGGTEER